jgi:glucokinase
MKLLLAGDIGGTSTRLRLAVAAADRWRSHEWEQTYPSQDFPDLGPVVKKFLAEMGIEGEVVSACFAVAGPVVDGVATLQNLAWKLETDRLSQELGIANIHLINDFAAIGYGLAHLRPEELHVLQIGEPVAQGPRAVLGAGTGLGQGYLVWQHDRYAVLASEGGHSDFAARSALEFQLLEYVMHRYGLDHVSYDRLISGRGIMDMYRFLQEREPHSVKVPAFAERSDQEITEALHQWDTSAVTEHSHLVDPAAAIAQAAGSNPLATAAMEMFMSAYGAEAGNLALKFLPRGGLYIAGGIATKNLSLLTAGTFMQAFSQKGRMVPVVGQIPVSVVLNPQVGLIGAAAQAWSLVGGG